MKLSIDYIARVEGEGTVKLEIKDGRLVDLKLNIWEPPRFFEGFLKGRRYDEVPDIVARICGICPVSHMTTAIRAIENALSITPSPEAVRLRKIMAASQIAASHLVHLYMLAMPDYFGLRSIAEMLPRFEKEIKRLMKTKEVLNGITSAFGGGRALHPVSMVVAGFTDVPSKEAIGKLIIGLEGIKDDALETLKMTASLNYPEFNTSPEYAALSDDGGYAITGGRIVSSGGIDSAEENYKELFEETEVPYANAKRTVVKGRGAGGALMVGALARLNLKFGMLHEDAKAASASIGFTPPSSNPFHNNLAQAVEVVHFISELIEFLEGVSGERPLVDIKVVEGEGSAITEAPRGLLYHSYAINGRGIVERADIVTPTAHNFLSLEESLRKLVGEHINEPPESLKLKCEMLVRAYDPCFSCSVH